MRADQAKSIPLADFITNIGYERTSESGREVFFNLRGERTPSFCVNPSKNTWYDHGVGTGGNIIDFAMIWLGASDVSGALAIIEERWLSHSCAPKIAHPVAPEPLTGSEITKVTDLEHPALIEYVESRGIPARLAKKYTRQVHYRNRGREFFTVGFKNDSGGFEHRNKMFKGCIGSKDISVIPGRCDHRIWVFEGFFDFLTAVYLDNDAQTRPISIILNSTSLIERAIQYIAQFDEIEEVELFLDRDRIGVAASTIVSDRLLCSTMVSVKDCSQKYKGFKDLNEMLCATL